MNKYQESNRSSGLGLLLGVLVGGAAGVGLAYLLKDKSFRSQIKKGYQTARSRAEEFASEAIEKGEDAYEASSEYLQEAKEKGADVIFETLNANPHLVIGAIAGGALGALAGAFVAKRKSGRFYNANGFAHYAHERKNWLPVIQQVLETINDRFLKTNVEEHETSAQKTLHDVLELTNAGIRVWQNIKERS